MGRFLLSAATWILLVTLPLARAQQSAATPAAPFDFLTSLSVGQELLKKGNCAILFGKSTYLPELDTQIVFVLVERPADVVWKERQDLPRESIVHAYRKWDEPLRVYITPHFWHQDPLRRAAILAHEVEVHIKRRMTDRQAMRVLCPKEKSGNTGCITDAIARGCEQLRNLSPGEVLADLDRLDIRVPLA